MKTVRELQLCCILTVMVFPLIGCGEKLPSDLPALVPCEIIVTQEGKPLEGAVVRLQPTDNSEWTAMGRTDSSGKMSVFTRDKYKGAVPGKYKVIISKSEIGAGQEGKSFYLVDQQFGTVASTPLEINVVKGTPTHTVDVGEAVRIEVENRR